MARTPAPRKRPVKELPKFLTRREVAEAAAQGIELRDPNDRTPLPPDAPPQAGEIQWQDNDGTSWSPRMEKLIAWFLTRHRDGLLPEIPFDLQFQWRILGKHHYTLILADIEEGPAGVRARNGLLEHYLQAHYRLANGGRSFTGEE